MEKKRESTRNGVIVITGAVSLVIVAIMLGWLHSFFFTVRNQEIYRKVLAAENPALRELQAAEAEIMNSYAWVDQEQGVVRIPIDRAMEILVEEARAARGGQED